jgi:hypothetical protein
MIQSIQSQVAKNGIKAEKLLLVNADAKSVLQTYFGKNIQRIVPVRGGKKSDIMITFEDGEHARLQNKNGTGGGRGWSADRRKISDMPLEDD